MLNFDWEDVLNNDGECVGKELVCTRCHSVVFKFGDGPVCIYCDDPENERQVM